MKTRSISILLISGVVIVIIAFTAYLLQHTNNSILQNIFNKIPFISREETIPSFSITDEVNNYSYNFDSSIHDQSKILEELRGTDIDSYKKKVVITSDSTKKGASLIRQGMTIGGYGNFIDYEKGVVYLYIYINPEVDDKDLILFYINKAYLGALLSAVEENKHYRDAMYRADYQKVAAIAHEITIENADNNYSFITYEN